MAFELGATLVLARVGAVPPEADAPRRETWTGALGELGRRADHRGVRLAVEAGTESGEALRAALESLGPAGLAASLDPAALLQHGHDPVAATRALGEWVAHAYASDATSSRPASLDDQPPRLGIPAGRTRLGGVPRRPGGDQLPGLPHRLARPGARPRRPVHRHGRTTQAVLSGPEDVPTGPFVAVRIEARWVGA